MYNMINRRLFDEELPDCTIILFGATDYKKLSIDNPINGFCQPVQDCWLIGIDKTLSDKEYFDTLVHEMIHIWQGENNLEMDHKKSFQYMCAKAYEEFYE